jgi:hypothetical protein
VAITARFASTACALAVMVGCGGRGPEGPEDDSSRFVAVGEAGAIWVSDEGASWSAAESGVNQDLRSVAYAGTNLVAVGEGGTILWSPDGLSWNEADTDAASDLEDVVLRGDTLIAVGGSWETGAEIVVSRDDGRSWQTWPAPADHMFHAVAAGLHPDGAIAFAAAYGRNDQQRPSLFAYLEASPPVQGTGPDFYDSLDLPRLGELLVVGDRAVSTWSDGAWTTRQLPTERLLYAVYWSSDRANWIAAADVTPNVWLRGVAHGGGRFVAVGDEALVSADGEAWAPGNLPDGETLSAVAYRDAAR